jgi:hypothetical protein
MSDAAILPNPSQPNIYGPITAGQMFERTFTLLRENFSLFFGIVLILVGVEIVFGGISAGFMGGNALLMGRSTVGPASIGRILFLAPVMFVGGVLLFILIQIIQGALFFATSARLTHTPITVGDACKAAADQVGRLIGISLLILVRVIGYILLFFTAFAVVVGIIAVFSGIMHGAAGNPFSGGHLPSFGVIALLVLVLGAAVIAYLIFWLWLVSRYALSIPAALAENLSVTESIRRSIHLGKGSRGRLYALFLAIVAIDLAIALVTVPFQLMAAHGAWGHQTAVFGAVGLLMAGFRILISAIIVAIMGIATALCYYDLRVRKEGLGVVTPPAPAVPVAPAEAWPLPPDQPTGDLPIS